MRKIRVRDLKRVIREELERAQLNEWQEQPSSFEEFATSNNVAVAGIKKEVDRIAAAYQGSAENPELSKKIVTAGTLGAVKAVFAVMQKALWSSGQGAVRG